MELAALEQMQCMVQGQGRGPPAHRGWRQPASSVVMESRLVTSGGNSRHSIVLVTAEAQCGVCGTGQTHVQDAVSPNRH